jgi:hypothetical protein
MDGYLVVGWLLETLQLNFLYKSVTYHVSCLVTLSFKNRDIKAYTLVTSKFGSHTHRELVIPENLGNQATNR